MCIALCCHQVCEYEAYPNKTFLEKHGVDKKAFNCVRLLSSWANCGWEKRKALETTSALASLTVEEREEIGRACKRFLDLGRLR